MKLNNNPTTARVLGFPVLCALVMGNMIGSGIFLLPVSLAPFGGLSLIAWLITSIGAMLLAYIFAKLSSTMPREGGPYAFCREGFGEFIGFQIAYNYWIAIIVANVATIVAMVAYLTVFWPELAHQPLLALSIALFSIWLITAINLIGVGEAGHTQLVLTIIKIVPLILLIVIGIHEVKWEHFRVTAVDTKQIFSGIAQATALSLWAFTGLESATVPAAYARHPHITIPRATMVGTFGAALVYVMSTILVMGILPPAQLAQSHAPFSEVAQKLIGSSGAYVIAAIAALSCFACTVGWVLLQAQIPLAAARDGLFPKVFTKVNAKSTPVIGLVISSTFASVLLICNYQSSLVEQFTILVKCSTLAFLIPYLYTTIAKLLLLIHHPARFPYKFKFWVVLAALLAYVYIFCAIFGLGEELVYYGALLFFTGIPLYIWVKLQQAPKHAVVELTD